MEALGVGASLITVIDLSAKVATLCFQYSAEVASARADITRLQSQVNHLCVAFRSAQTLLEDSAGRPLSVSRELIDSLQECAVELGRLQDKLGLGKARKAMLRFGLRALRWPFSRKEIESIIANLKGWEQIILLGLQVDQTKLLLNITDKVEGMSLQPAEDLSTARKPHFMIAIQLAYHVHAASPNTNVFWVLASTKARFKESYESIADTLALPRRHDPSVNILALVRDWLQKEDASPWLMILDNADDASMLFSNEEGGDKTQVPIASYLPKTVRGKILVTSRSIDAAEKLTGNHKTILRIPPMDSSQALELIRNTLDGAVDETAAMDLVSTLDFIPLAVNQAAAYINRRTPLVTIHSYLADFEKSEKRRESLLNSDTGDLRRHEGVSNAVVVTWQVTFEQIRKQRPTAANLLSLMSQFQAQSIPNYVLQGYADISSDDGENDDGGFEDDLDVLRGYSLVNITTTQGFFEMHSLVQFCTQAWLSKFDESRRWKKLFLSLASKNFPDGEFETWEQCQTLLPHFQSLLKEEPTQESDRLIWSELLTRMSRYMRIRGDFYKAEKFAEMAVAVEKVILGIKEDGKKQKR
ncbi:hypothetical protein G7Z17_g4689 [Cylindrodendrum hubeiense]|uniref:Fungal N-terminal domain-containing protein n=1 Tax=Cylindrodendrum hubeiense TaxID=595255 RepID=A0A9P5LIL5_9HYPO|nr:hypothetical protein G7Z17_g4689 [Cylindrodendrum hubeiense]